mgnify:CR=1 FL=1
MPLNESDIELDNFQMKESSIKIEDVPYIEDKSKAYYFFKRLFDMVSSFLVLIILFCSQIIEILIQKGFRRICHLFLMIPILIWKN